MGKITRYFSNYQEAYNYYGGTNVPSKEIALVGDASYVFVSSDNAGDGGNTQYFDAAMTNDEIVATQVDAAYVSGTTQGYEQGYNEGYPLGYTAGHTAGYTEGEAAGYTTGHSAGYAEGEADYIAGMIENGTMAITTTSQVDVMEYAYAQVSDANLTAGNIADGVTILGVTGTYSGGIQPSGTMYISEADITYDVTNYAYAVAQDSNLSSDNIKSGVTIFGVTGTYSGGGSLDPTSDIVKDASKWQVLNYGADGPYSANSMPFVEDQQIEAMDVEWYAEEIDTIGDENMVALIDKFNTRGTVEVLSGTQNVTISYQRNDPEDPNTNAYISIDIALEAGERAGLSLAWFSHDPEDESSYFFEGFYWGIEDNVSNNHWIITAAETGTYNIMLEADGNGGCSMTITAPR